MSSQAIDVQVQLLTEINDEERQESMEITESGRYMTRGETKVLTFTEHPDEGEPVQTMITMKPDYASIKRSGGVDMRQVFQLKTETENLYHHTYGNFHMKTYTKRLNFRALEEERKGQLYIEYTMTLNGEVTQTHRLTLTFEEEGEA